MAKKRKQPVRQPAQAARITNTNRGENKKLIVNQIVIRPMTRKTSDVDTWRNALQSADMGRVKQLFDLYEDLLIDGVLSDALDKRISAVTNSELTFQDADGSEVEEICGLIDSPAWEEVLTGIMQARFWGRGGIEFDFTTGFGATPIPPKHIKIETQQILLNEYDDSGISYATDDHILVVGKKRDLGLLLKTAPYAIYKRGAYGDYAQWLEIFGMPQRVGKYSSYDPESRKLLEDAMERSGSAPWLVIPKESEVETISAGSNGAGQSPYDEFRKACNEEMLITILGQTMTTVQGDKGARSLGEVHKEVEEGKNKADMRFVQRVLNHYVLPMLEKRGYPVTGGKFIFPKAAEALGVGDIVSLAGIMPIPLSYLHDKYSIPAPIDGEPVAGSTVGADNNPPGKSVSDPNTPDANSDDPTPDPVIKPQKPNKPIKNHDDAGFLRRIYDFFVNAPAVMTGASIGDLLTLSDTNLSDRIIKFVAVGGGSFNAELFNFIANDLITALDHRPVQMADLGFVYNYQNDAFRTAQELNIYHFSAAKDLAEIQRLNELYRQSKSFDEFYKLALVEVDVFNKTWQKTEWQTASLIAASSENYNRLNSKTKLFPYWEYKTVGDDKVRPEHQLLDGVILPANDPRWQKIWPPNGWLCRCYIVPRMKAEVAGIDIEAMRARVDAYLESPDWSSAQANGFGVNRALGPELFNENQMYIQKFAKQEATFLKDINYETYGLKPLDEIRTSTDRTLDFYNGTAADFFKQLVNEDGKIFFKDYNDRSVLFDETAYLKGHTADKYAERTILLNGVNDTIKAPDEVWINNGDGKLFNRYIFLKYYKDQTLAVVAEVSEGTVYQIKTWFKIEESTGSTVPKHKYRRGLLIKKPGF